MTETNESTAPRPTGILRNPRWERFAHEIARGSTADAAYQAAGYAQSRGNASRLRAVEIVDRRVDELKKLVENIQKLSTHKTVLTQAFVIENLIGIVIDARSQEKPDYAGANKALNLLGLELGMFVERKEISKTGDFDGLTIEGKRERIMSVARQLGLAPISEDGRYRLGAIDKKPDDIEQ
jgi:phage terminase small subunit